MASSMTGLGFGEEKYNSTVIQAEIRSVNNRFLEISCRLPSMMSQYEGEVRELVRKHIHRGKLYITVTIQGEDTGLFELRVNTTIARSVMALLEQLREAIPFSSPYITRILSSISIYPSGSIFLPIFFYMFPSG